MDPRASILQTVFKNNMNKSFLQIQHNKIKKEQKEPTIQKVPQQTIQKKVDGNTGRLSRYFDVPTTFTTIKKQGFLYTKKQNKGFWSFCVCNSSGKRSEKVVIDNRVLTIRGKDDRIIETINFDTASVELKKSKNSVKIIVKGEGKQQNRKQIYLEAPPQEDVEEWIQLLERGIQGSQGDIYDLSYITTVPDFLNTLSIPQKQFSSKCNSGDILLFKSSHGMAKMQRNLTGSQYDHIALVLRNQKNEILLFESNSDTGVALSFWKDMVQYKWYDGAERIVYRKLNIKRSEQFLSKLEQFVVDNIDKKFEVSLGKLFTFTSKVMTKEESEKRTYFCSELIAKCYKHLGLLPEQKSSTQYWPVDFTENRTLNLLEGSFGPQQLICFDKQLCNTK